eukprot:scaffold2830_cov123-Isochrysis_galbana.AAC.24
MVRPSQHGAGQGQAVPQAFGRAENCTWVELSSVLSARTRLRPLSAPISASMGSNRSWRGAIVTLHALAERRAEHTAYPFPTPTSRTLGWRPSSATKLRTSLTTRQLPPGINISGCDRDHSAWRRRASTSLPGQSRRARTAMLRLAGLALAFITVAARCWSAVTITSSVADSRRGEGGGTVRTWQVHMLHGRCASP